MAIDIRKESVEHDESLGVSTAKKARLERLLTVEEKRVSWKKLLSEFKRNENFFENFVQTTLIIIVSLISFSETATVKALEKSVILDKNAALVTLSAAWSFRTLIMGQLAFLSMTKDGYLPLNGKIIMFMYFCITVSSRIVAICLFFTPGLGLFNTLWHWKMGIIPVDEMADFILDVSIVNDTTLGVRRVKHAWVPVKSPSDLTGLGLQSYFFVFIALYLCYLAVAAALHYWYSWKNSKVKAASKRTIHVIFQILCPTIFRDWDEEPMEVMEASTSNIKKIYGVKIATSTIFNLLHCIPLYVLWGRIQQRNEMLEKDFDLLTEELSSSYRVMLLSLLGTLYFLMVAVLQVLFLWLYYRAGHPWRRLWTLLEAQEDAEKEDENSLNLDNLFE